MENLTDTQSLLVNTGLITLMIPHRDKTLNLFSKNQPVFDAECKPIPSNTGCDTVSRYSYRGIHFNVIPSFDTDGVYIH